MVNPIEAKKGDSTEATLESCGAIASYSGASYSGASYSGASYSGIGQLGLKGKIPSSLAIALTLLSSVSFSFSRSSDTKSTTAAETTPASDFKPLTIVGEQNLRAVAAAANGFNLSAPLSVEALQGRIVVLDFWATWCGPCLAKIPAMNELQKKFGEKGVVIIGVADKSDTPAKVVSKLSQLQYPIALERDPEGKTFSNQATSHFGITAFPSIVILGPDGEILKPLDLMPGLNQAARSVQSPAGASTELASGVWVSPDEKDLSEAIQHAVDTHTVRTDTLKPTPGATWGSDAAAALKAYNSSRPFSLRAFNEVKFNELPIQDAFAKAREFFNANSGQSSEEVDVRNCAILQIGSLARTPHADLTSPSGAVTSARMYGVIQLLEILSAPSETNPEIYSAIIGQLASASRDMTNMTERLTMRDRIMPFTDFVEKHTSPYDRALFSLLAERLGGPALDPTRKQPFTLLRREQSPEEAATLAGILKAADELKVEREGEIDAEMLNKLMVFAFDGDVRLPSKAVDIEVLERRNLGLALCQKIDPKKTSATILAPLQQRLASLLLAEGDVDWLYTYQLCRQLSHVGVSGIGKDSSTRNVPAQLQETLRVFEKNQDLTLIARELRLILEDSAQQ